MLCKVIHSAASAHDQRIMHGGYNLALFLSKSTPFRPYFHHSYGLSTTCTSSCFRLLSSSSSRSKLPLLRPLLTLVISCRLLFVLRLASSIRFPLSAHCRRDTRIGGGRPSSHVAPVLCRCTGPACAVYCGCSRSMLALLIPTPGAGAWVGRCSQRSCGVHAVRASPASCWSRRVKRSRSEERECRGGASSWYICEPVG